METEADVGFEAGNWTLDGSGPAGHDVTRASWASILHPPSPNSQSYSHTEYNYKVCIWVGVDLKNAKKIRNCLDTGS